MKRVLIGAGLAATVLLGPAALSAQASQTTTSCGCTSGHGHHRAHEGGKHHHGHHGKPAHHKPRPHPKPRPHNPPVCQPPAHHPKPGHGHHQKPPHGHKPPLPTPHPRPPVVTPQSHVTRPVIHKPGSHIDGHLRTVTPTAQLAFTGPAEYAILGGAAVVFLVLGGGLVALTGTSRRQTKAWKR